MAFRFFRTGFRSVLVCMGLVCSAAPHAVAQNQDAPGFPPQLEMSVLHAPVPFPAGGRTHLVYEIYVRSFASRPLTLQKLEVLDASRPAGEPVAVFEANELDVMLLRLGAPPGTREPAQPLPPGGTLVVYVSIPLPDKPKSDRLVHRVQVDGMSVEGAVVTPARLRLPELGPPVAGSSWRVFGGPDNRAGHRRGIVVFGGRPEISRRYAVDWVQVANGQTFIGDATDNRAYLAYGKDVLAVADAAVLAVRDGQADNTPGQSPPAMPFDAINGNYIILDLGRGLFARYLHLQPGSLHVRPGQRIRRGEVVARIGNSGDSRQPHLHFDVSDSRDVLAGEGVPFLTDEFWLVPNEGPPTLRKREVLVPGGASTVSFEKPAN